MSTIDFSTIKDSRERKTQILQELDRLLSQLILNPKQIRELAARWRSGFHRYSWNNLLLIYMQKPDATLCAGFKTWKAHKRYVRKGEKAIWILGPYVKTEPHRTTDDLTSDEMVVDEPRIVGYFPVPTFDISQTEGEPLDLGANQVKFLGQEFTLEDIVSKFPEYPVKIVDRVEDGRAVKNVIEVSRRKNRAQMIISYFHELAHILLGHTSSEQVRGVDRSRSLEELEAEAVAYIVGSCLGIESEDSVTYITGWNGNPEKLKKVTFSIAKTADRILRRFTTTSNDSTSCVYNKTYGGS